MDFITFILTVMFVTGVVSFALAALIRTSWLCIVASAVIAELLYMLYILAQVSSFPYPEDLLLGVNITLAIGTPVFVLSAVGFTFLARWIYQKARANG